MMLQKETISTQSLPDSDAATENKEYQQDDATLNVKELYAIYVPRPGTESENFSDFIFKSKMDCLVHLRKHRGARFKTFQNYKDALNFTIYGPINVSSPMKVLPGPASLKEEKPSPFSTPTPQQHIIFRKTIERGDLNMFNDFIETNPRYLVSKADTPSILKEGPRYNALHVACIHNKPDFCYRVLECITPTSFFKQIYPDDTDDCAKRRCDHLLDLYLNTPDKGFNRTPVHYASSFGFVECIRVLVSYPNCEKDALDKYKNTPMQLILTRATNKPRSDDVRAEIEILLGDHYYVPFYCDEQNLFSPKIAKPISPSVRQELPPNINDQLNESIGSCFSPSYQLHGYAGPMSPQQAKGFYSMWKTPAAGSPRAKNRLKTNGSQLQGIGRDLAFDLKLPWKEYWGFLGEFINISSDDGLQKLELHLKKMFNQVLMERNKQRDDTAGFIGIDKLSSEKNSNANCDISASKISSVSTMGGLSRHFSQLRLYSPTAAGMESFSKYCEIMGSPIQSVNNNSTYVDSEKDLLDLMEYANKSTGITSAKIIPMFEEYCVEVSHPPNKLQRVRSEICTQLNCLRSVLCRLNIDLIFVHAVLALKIANYLYSNSYNLTYLKTVIESLLQLDKASESEPIDDCIYGHFECLCKNLEEIISTHKKNGAIESPTCKCTCSWLAVSDEGIKYKKAHSFINRLFVADDKSQNHSSVVRHLSFSEDDESPDGIEDDSESFVTVNSSTGDSMETPEGTFSFFIYGSHPSRIDYLVLSAIEKIEIDEDLFPFTNQWLGVMSSYTLEQRKCWPSRCGNEELDADFSNPSKGVISSTPKQLQNYLFSHCNSPS